MTATAQDGLRRFVLDVRFLCIVDLSDTKPATTLRPGMPR
jgi:hypothetical protein